MQGADCYAIRVFQRLAVLWLGLPKRCLSGIDLVLAAHALLAQRLSVLWCKVQPALGSDVGVRCVGPEIGSALAPRLFHMRRCVDGICW